MESDKISDVEMPCELASDRRRPVSGPDGVKLTTEGNGGAESQAPSAANATGQGTTEAAGTEPEPGPVLYSRKQSARYCARKRRQQRRLQQRKAGAASGDKKEAGAASTSGAKSEPGNGRDGKKLNEPNTIPQTKQNGGNSHRIKIKERKRREAELLDAFYEQERQGVIKMPDLAALAPAIAACMARLNSPTDGAPMALSTSVKDCGQDRGVMNPTGSDAEPVKVNGSPDRGSLAEGGKTNQKNPVMRETWRVPSQTDPHPAEKAARPQSKPEPKPGQFKGKGVGKGQKGRAVAAIEVGGVSASDTPKESKEEDATRGAKRQRSSDQVSPTGRVADKKVCLEGGSAVAVANPRAVTSKSDAEGAPSSYAAAIKMTRVVILDRAGIQMDETRATLLKKVIIEAQFALFKSNRGKPKKERSLPTFSQGPRLAHGGLLMSPASDFALKWLYSAVGNLPILWEGSGGLKIVLEKDLPKYHTGVIYVPDFKVDGEDPEGWPNTLREYLADLNEDLDIDNWPIFTHLVKQKGKCYNHVLVMGIPDEDLPTLRQKSFRLFYTVSKIFVKLKTGKKVKGPSTTSAVATTASNSGDPETRTDDENKVTDTPDHVGLTDEEVELLLQVDDEGAEDFLGVFKNLNVLSPASSIDAERPGPSSVKSSKQ